MTRRADHDLESRLERAMLTPTEEAMRELVRERDLRLRDIQRAGYGSVPATERPEHSPTDAVCLACGNAVEPGKNCEGCMFSAFCAGFDESGEGWNGEYPESEAFHARGGLERLRYAFARHLKDSTPAMVRAPEAPPVKNAFGFPGGAPSGPDPCDICAGRDGTHSRGCADHPDSPQRIGATK